MYATGPTSLARDFYVKMKKKDHHENALGILVDSIYLNVITSRAVVSYSESVWYTSWILLNYYWFLQITIDQSPLFKVNTKVNNCVWFLCSPSKIANIKSNPPEDARNENTNASKWRIQGWNFDLFICFSELDKEVDLLL